MASSYEVYTTGFVKTFLMTESDKLPTSKKKTDLGYKKNGEEKT